MGKKIIVSFIMFFVTYNGFSQDEIFNRLNMFRASLTFCNGYMLTAKINNIYIHGDMEYYINRHAGIRGDSYLYTGAQSFQDRIFRKNISAFSGIAFHISERRIDPYIAIQPGVSFTKLAKDDIEQNNSFVVSPLFSMAGGIHYFLSNFFHVAFSVRYLHGVRLDQTSELMLDELRFSAGLGWNITFKNQAVRTFSQ